MTAPSDSAVLEDKATPYSALRASHSALRPSSSFVPLLCCIALMAALAWPMFAGRVYVADDLGAFHLPLRAFYSQQLGAGEPFDWDPEMFGGFYLTGEGQAGTYHPLHWLLYRILPLNLAFDLECWLSYPVMLAGMYAFLRRWRLHRNAALFGAMAFTFGSFNLLHFVHPNAIAIVAHLPWLLVAIDVLLRNSSPLWGEGRERGNRNRRLAFAAIALLTASQLLLGYPQYVFLSLLFEAGYVLFLAVSERSSWRVFLRRLCHWAAAAVIGGLIGGVQLLPTLDALTHSVRQSASADLTNQGSLHPLNLIQLLAPYLFTTRVVGQNTHELGLYVGAVPLVLAVWWLINGRARNRQRRLTIFATITAIVALVWALGALGPLGWLEANVPLVNRFRFPCRAIVLFQLAVAALAALGFASLLRRSFKNSSPSRGEGRERVRVPHTARLCWLLAISVMFAILGPICWPANVAGWPLIVAGPLLFAIAAWLTIRAANGSRWALAAIVIFAAADLGAYGTTYSIVGKTETLTDYIRATDAPPGPANARIAIDLMSGTETANGEHGKRIGDRVLLSGWKCIDGYTGLEPSRRLDYRVPAALRAGGVAWISAQAADNIKASDGQQITDTSPTSGWYAIANTQPRAWLVTRVVASDNPASDISRISLADEALVDQPLPSPLPESTPGTAKIAIDRPGHLELDVSSPAAQFLVVSESHHDGWHATIDGKFAPVFRANGDFLGLAVPAGEHKIAFEFSPKSLDLGRLMSQFGLGLIGVIVFWPRSAAAQSPTKR